MNPRRNDPTPTAFCSGAFKRNGLVLGLLLSLPGLSTCSWSRSPEGIAPRPYLVSEVHEAPRLLYCSKYRLPFRGEIYENKIQLEFDVTPDGFVTNVRIVEEGGVASSQTAYGEAVSKVRTCTFSPGQFWGKPVAVRMSMWFLW